ncbi:interferon regulatory factor 3-like [Hyperolius riggenbachi]|uniref:interferon regulatory factor 3-like n=1 Tax=Hyperolius riggenbachi TaxID=752182 RepID=UPI0035A38BDB
MKMASNKPRIIPWLKEQISSQAYPGLRWYNAEKTQFTIPWKHGLRQDRTLEDVGIFEAWACASGSYNPDTDQPNPAVWKRNFRSALNRKSEIRVIQDSSSDSSNPHKIYEFVSGDTPTSGVSSADLYSSDSYPSISPSSDTVPFSSPTCTLSVDTVFLPDLLNISQMQISEEDLYLAPEDLPSSVLGEAQDWYRNIGTPDVFVPEVSPVGPDTSPYSTYPEQPGEAAGCSEEDQTAHHQQHLLSQFFPNSTFETQFEVKIYYRKNLVGSVHVTNPRGFRLTSKPQNNPEAYLQDVALPPHTAISDLKVGSKIKELLQNLEHGTLVEVQNGSICAKRLGKCRSYWSMTDSPPTTQPNQISKDSYSVLYNFQQFVKELIAFIEQKRRESPQYDIWICLGELWPDGYSWKEKLIMVQVTPISMQLLHQMSYSNGASSLRSSDINLQISDSLRSTSDILSFLREFEDRME